MTTLVPFLMLRISKLPFNKPFSCLCNCIRFAWEVSEIVVAYRPGYMAPVVANPLWICPVLLHYQPPFWLISGGEEVPHGNFILLLQVKAAYSRDGCYWFLCSFVGVVWNFLLSSSLPAKFLVGWRFSYGDRGCLPFEDCRQIINFTPLPFYSGGKSPRYPFGRRLGEPQCYGGAKKFPLPVIESRPSNS